jgi:uncharacterized protein (DUF2236 family)
MPRDLQPFVRPPRGGITWRLAGERLGLLARRRAILLQITQPLVAAGVGDHSSFRGSPRASRTDRIRPGFAWSRVRARRRRRERLSLK